MTNWNTFDLNLLVVFDAVMQEKNLTRTGQRFGLTQSAVSHALARLRHMLNDELFVRTPEGMRQPRGRSGWPSRSIRRCKRCASYLEADAFEPSQASHTFIIAANNYAARAVIPAFVRHVAARGAFGRGRGPAARQVATRSSQLDAGAVELALETLAEGGERFKCVGLLEDELCGDPAARSSRGQRADAVGGAYRGPAPYHHHLQRRRYAVRRRRTRRAWACAPRLGAGSRCIRYCPSLSDPRRWRSCQGESPRTSSPPRPADHPAAAIRIAACVALDDLASPAGPPRGASLAARNPAGVGQGVVAEPPHHCRKIPCA